MEEKIVEILGALQTSVKDLAPEAWLALVLAARVDAILSVAYCIVIFAAMAVYALTVRRTMAWIDSVNDNEPLFVIWGIASLVLAILVAIAVVTLFSTSTWLGLFYPEAAVVRDLLTKAAG